MSETRASLERRMRAIQSQPACDGCIRSLPWPHAFLGYADCRDSRRELESARSELFRLDSLAVSRG